MYGSLGYSLPSTPVCFKSDTLPFSRKTDTGKGKLLASLNNSPEKVRQAGNSLFSSVCGRMNMGSPGRIPSAPAGRRHVSLDDVRGNHNLQHVPGFSMCALLGNAVVCKDQSFSSMGCWDGKWSWRSSLISTLLFSLRAAVLPT